MYYKPGSRMAHTCVHGAELMYKYCEENDLPAERCGKFIVASNEAEHVQVEKLYHQGNANGVQGLEIFSGEKVCAAIERTKLCARELNTTLLCFTQRSENMNRILRPTVHCTRQTLVS